MSVPEGKRSQGRMEVFVKARQLATHTARICSNKNIFKPEIDEELICRLKSYAYDIYSESWEANKIRAETNNVNRKMRYEKQEKALLLCDRMLVHISIAKQVFHLKSKKVKYWTQLIIEVQKLLQAWKESDVKRYGQP